MGGSAFTEGRGDAHQQVAAELVVDFFAAANPAEVSVIVGFRCCLVLPQDATKPAFREFVFTDTGVRLS